MNAILSVPASLTDRKEFEAYVQAMILDKFNKNIINKSSVSSMMVHIKKVGAFYNFHITMKYKGIDFQLLKKDKSPFKAASLAIKGLKRMYLDNTKRMNPRFNLDEINKVNHSLEAS